MHQHKDLSPKPYQKQGMYTYVAIAVLSLSCAHRPSSQNVSSFRAHQPIAGPAPSFEAPLPEKHTLANGLTLLFHHKPQLPLVHLRIAVSKGSAHDPHDLPGLSGFAVEAMQSGTHSRSSQDIAEAIELLGGHLHSSISPEVMSFSTTVLKDHYPKAFKVMSDVVLHPNFNSSEINRIKKRRKAALQKQQSMPRDIANRLFREEIYGSHPYGHDELGHSASIEAITSKSLKRFHQQHWTPKAGLVVVVGDLSFPEAIKLVEDELGTWAGGQHPSQDDYKQPKQHAKGLKLYDRPNAPQSQLRIGHLGVPQNHPDYFPLVMMNAVLGGLFQSRLNMNLREDKGYTYGARSYFNFGRMGGSWTVGTAVETLVTVPAINEVLKEINKMIRSGVTSDELHGAQQRYTLSLAGYFQSLEGVAGVFEKLFSLNLPLDYYRKLTQEIQSVTVDDVQQAAQKHLRPQDLAIIVVGDKNRLEKDLGKLGLGPSTAN
jgi:zinc protease